MELQTKVKIQKATFCINPQDRILFVGSCFAENIGRRFRDNKFRATVNPYGTMYNPASVLHTIEKYIGTGTPSKGSGEGTDVVVITLGTNHVYIENATGEIVDNCQKRPQSLFTEKELTVDECAEYLQRAIDIIKGANPSAHVILTVSPIRYAKYGYHESQLSKATLLLAVEKVEGAYFPSYEIVMDELRDYRFYKEDMLHPSEQAVDYIYERFKEVFFSEEAYAMEAEWQPIFKALNHRVFNPENEDSKKFLIKTMQKLDTFRKKWKLDD